MKILIFRLLEERNNNARKVDLPGVDSRVTPAPYTKSPPGQMAPGQLAAAPGFHPCYKAWTFRKLTVDEMKVHLGKPNVQFLSWQHLAAVPSTYSNEELFLQVVDLIAENAKKGRTLQDVYNGLRTRKQRQAIDVLIEDQNQLLQ